MPGLIVFLHGLTGNENSWGAVPEYLQSDDFDVTTPTYSASINGLSDVEISAQRILTEIRTRFPDHSPICFAGHSLGGLVAREICRHLLLQGPDDFLNKVPAVITLGTPLEGARIGNWLLRKLPFLSPKIHQIATESYAFGEYRRAIAAAKQRKVSRPKQLHIQMEEDGVIARQIETRFTEDDRSAAVIGGSHQHFADNNDDAKFLADLLLRLIREAQNSLSAPSIPRPAPAPIHDLPDRLVLIACSHNKRDGGQEGYDDGRPVAWINEQNLRQKIINRRTYTYGLVKDGKLADGFERGGNRAFQPANATLQHGPDLGGTKVLGHSISYRRASNRYNGRIYGPVTDASWDAYAGNRSRMRVLIMSGLYGLIEPEELIQNYDVHLTDSHIESGQSVSSIWSELYTESLENYVRHAYRNRKVHIYNLLCDHNYVDSIRWHKLTRSKCSVFHLASPDFEDVELLPPAGVILNAVLADPQLLEGIHVDDRDKKIYSMADFNAAPPGLADTRIIFESRVGNSKR
jgi:pimeloyl-ACP methyl ester carboxylesterase